MDVSFWLYFANWLHFQRNAGVSMKTQILAVLLCAASLQAQNTLKDLLAKATQGDLNSEIAVGDAYNFGRGTGINYRKAEEWYKAAAGQGSGYAAYQIGQEYLQDHRAQTRGLARIPYSDPVYNMQMGRIYMLQSATLGFGPGYAWMGWYYEEGYRMGQSVGDSSSTTTIQEPQPESNGGGFIGGLAEGIARSRGADQTRIDTSTSTVGRSNYSDAMEWYRKGADVNDLDCEFALGRFYEQGLGVKKDPALAMKWYAEAASKGYPRAKVRLELLFEQYGTPTATCKDGTLSFSHHDSGTCAGHGGVEEWVKDPAPTQ
jgi:TPR repeat protein